MVIAIALLLIVLLVGIVFRRCLRNASPSIGSGLDSCADWGGEGRQ